MKRWITIIGLGIAVLGPLVSAAAAESQDLLPGDVNGDGWVAESDLSTIIAYWGQSGLGRDYGDLNGNGVVDGPDYSEVMSYWQTPEPATLMVLALSGLSVLIRRKK